MCCSGSNGWSLSVPCLIGGFRPSGRLGCATCPCSTRCGCRRYSFVVRVGTGDPRRRRWIERRYPTWCHPRTSRSGRRRYSGCFAWTGLLQRGSYRVVRSSPNGSRWIVRVGIGVRFDASRPIFPSCVRQRFDRLRRRSNEAERPETGGVRSGWFRWCWSKLRRSLIVRLVRPGGSRSGWGCPRPVGLCRRPLCARLRPARFPYRRTAGFPLCRIALFPYGWFSGRRSARWYVPRTVRYGDLPVLGMIRRGHGRTTSDPSFRRSRRIRGGALGIPPEPEELLGHGLPRPSVRIAVAPGHGSFRARGRGRPPGRRGCSNRFVYFSEPSSRRHDWDLRTVEPYGARRSDRRRDGRRGEPRAEPSPPRRRSRRIGRSAARPGASG